MKNDEDAGSGNPPLAVIVDLPIENGDLLIYLLLGVEILQTT